MAAERVETTENQSTANPGAGPRVVAVVGPTAVGKSALALGLAERLGGEIVSADSRQVYRLMDIGMAKPTPAEQARVRHHVIDLVEPDEPFTLVDFLQHAAAAIVDVSARGRLPLLVGGTGLYVWSLLRGYQVPAAPPNPDLRRELESRAATDGGVALFAELRAADPEAAARIDPRNLRRVIRALEVIRATGRPFSAQREQTGSRYRALVIGLTCDRIELRRRIDARVHSQLRAGLLAETVGLVACGYGFDLPSMTGLGYRQLGQYLRGELDLPGAIELLQRQTWRFARQQYTWFRLSDPEIHWLQADSSALDAALALLRDQL